MLDNGLHIDDSMVKVNQDGRTTVQSSLPCLLECGREITCASEVNDERIG